jgi:hypothetical protein
VIFAESAVRENGFAFAFSPNPDEFYPLSPYLLPRMEKRDYLLDQINVFAKALASVMSRLMGTADRIEVLVLRKELDEALKTRLDLDLEALLALPMAELEHRLWGETPLDLDEMDQLAYLLDEVAEKDYDMDRKAAQALALKLWLHVRLHSNTYSFDREARIQHLESAVG